ncbi:MAG: tetratricopeptide repeat protein [Phycisphaerae bacterium]|nr:tetratricopeptide repeat protein [Phycisphaerae bacterium]
MRRNRIIGLSGLVLVACVVMHGCASAGGAGAGSGQELSETGLKIERAHALARDAQAAEREGDLAAAIDLYKRAVVEYRDFGAAWNNLGALLLEDQKTMAASEAFKRAMDLLPRDPRPPTSLGVIWDRAGYPDEASRYYELALQRDPEHLPALRASAVLDQERGKGNDVTAQNIKRALLLETDTKWKEWFQREALKLRAKGFEG